MRFEIIGLFAIVYLGNENFSPNISQHSLSSNLFDRAQISIHIYAQRYYKDNILINF